MRVSTRLLGAGAVLLLALGVCLLAGPRPGAAEDKVAVWKPLLPPEQVDDLVKYVSDQLVKSIEAGPVKTEDPKDQEDAKKEWEAKLDSSALFVVLLSQIDKGGDPKQLAAWRGEGMKVFEALDKKDYPRAKELAAALPEARAGAAETPPVNVDAKSDVMLMNLFKLRSRGGLGFSPKVSNAVTDGIEARIIGYAKRPPSKNDMATEAPNIERMAYIVAAISEVAEAHTPAKKVADKDPKDWTMWNDDMRNAALELGAAAHARDAKKIKEAANNLNASCTSCHGTFRSTGS